MSVLVKVHTANAVNLYVVDPATNTSAVVIKNPTETATIELVDSATGIAPQEIQAKRIGNNLQIFVESEKADATDPDIIIEDYYATDEEAPIVGFAENGNAYAYVGENALTDASIPNLKNAVLASEVLGSNGAPVFTAFPSASGLGATSAGASAGAASGVNGWGWAAGAAVLGGAAALGFSHSGKGRFLPEESQSSTPLVHEPETKSFDLSSQADNNPEQVKFSGNAAPNAKIDIIDPATGKVIASTTADDNGDWEATVTEDPNTIPDIKEGDVYHLVATEDGKLPSETVLLPAVPPVAAGADGHIGDTTDPDAPIIASVTDSDGNETGDVTVTAPSTLNEGDRVVITIVDKTGEPTELTLTKTSDGYTLTDANGNAVSSDVATLDETTGTVTIEDTGVQADSSVSAITKDLADNSSATVTAVSGIADAPTLGAKENGDVVVTAPSDSVKVVVEYVATGSNDDSTTQLIATKDSSDGSWVLTDADGNAVSPDVAVVDSNGTITIKAAAVKDQSTVNATSTNINGLTSSTSTSEPAYYDDTTPESADAPTVTAEANGDVSVLPNTDTVTLKIEYINEDGTAADPIYITKDADGNWSAVDADGNATTLPTGVTLDTTTGEVVIPANLIKDGSNVVATAINGSGDEAQSDAQAKIDDADTTQADAPVIQANDDGSVQIQPGADNAQLVVTYTDEDGLEHTITATRDTATGQWTATDTVTNADGTTTTTDVTVATTPTDLTANPNEVSIDPTTGVISLGRDQVKDFSNVDATGSDEAGVADGTDTNHNKGAVAGTIGSPAEDGAASAPITTKKDDASTDEADAPTVTPETDGSATVEAGADNTKVVITFKDENGNDVTITATQDANGWTATMTVGDTTTTLGETDSSASDDDTKGIATIDPTTGTITIGRELIVDGGTVTATGSNDSSTVASATDSDTVAYDDASPESADTPKTEADKLGNVTITPGEDNTVVTVTYTPTGETSATGTLIATKTVDPETGAVTWTLTDGEGNAVADTVATIDPTTGVIELLGEAVEDYTDVTSTGTNAQGVSTNSNGDAASSSAKTTVDDADELVAETPVVTAVDGGSVTATPGSDNVQQVITYTDEDGVEHTITATRDQTTGDWTAKDSVDGALGNTAGDSVASIDADTGVVTIGKDKVKDLTAVTSIGSDPAGVEHPNDTDSNKSASAVAQADDDTPTEVDAPTVTPETDGSATVEAGADNTKVVITFKDENGNDVTITATKDADGWTATMTVDGTTTTLGETDSSASDDDTKGIATIDPTTGVVTIGRELIVDGGEVSAVATNGSGVSADAVTDTVHANDATPDTADAPTVEAQDNGDVTITPADDSQEITITYTPTGEDDNSGTLIVTKNVDPETGAVTWTLTDGDGNEVADTVASIDPTTGVVTLKADAVEDYTSVSATSENDNEKTNSDSAIAQVDDSDTTEADIPTATANDNGSVTVTPGDDNVQQTVVYTDEDGVEHTITATRDTTTGKWTASDSVDGDLGNTASDTVASIDPDTGVITIGSEEVKDFSNVTVSGSDVAGVADTSDTDHTKTTSATTKKDDASTDEADAPTVTPETDGSATVEAGADNTKVVITFKDENGNDVTITATQDANGWTATMTVGDTTTTLGETDSSASDDDTKGIATIDPTTGTVTIGRELIVDGGTVTATGSNDSSTVASATDSDTVAYDDASPESADTPKTEADKLGNVTITPGEDNTVVTVTYTPTGETSATGTLIATKTVDPETGAVTWTLTDGEGNAVADTVATIDPTTGVIELLGEAVEDYTDVTSTGTNAQGVSTDSNGDAASSSARTTVDDADELVAETPVVTAVDGGSVTAAPGSDNVQQVITYTDEDGVEHTITATRETTGDWTATDSVDGDLGNTAGDSVVSIDADTGVVTIGKDKVKDLTAVTSIGSDPAGVEHPNDTDSNKSASDVAQVDDDTPTEADAPTVDTDAKGGATVTPKADGDSATVVTTFTNEDGDTVTITATKGADGWTATMTVDGTTTTLGETDSSASDDDTKGIATIDPTTGAVTIGRELIVDGGEVSAVATNGSGVSADEVSAPVKANDDSPTVASDPTLTKSGDSIILTPAYDTQSITLTYTPKGESAEKSVEITKSVDTTTGEVTWNIPSDIASGVTANVDEDGNVTFTLSNDLFNLANPVSAMAKNDNDEESNTVSIKLDSSADAATITTGVDSDGRIIVTTESDGTKSSEATGKVVVTPGADNESIAISYTDTDGKAHVLTVTKGSDGTWTQTAHTVDGTASTDTSGYSIDSATGVVTFDATTTATSSTVTVTSTDENNNTATATATTVPVVDLTPTESDSVTTERLSDGGLVVSVPTDGDTYAYVVSYTDEVGTEHHLQVSQTSTGEWAVYDLGTSSTVDLSLTTALTTAELTALNITLDSTNGTLTFDKDALLDYSTVTVDSHNYWAAAEASQSDSRVDAESISTKARQNDDSPNFADDPAVALVATGDATITPTGDNVGMYITYIDNDGNTVAILAKKELLADGTGTWSAVDGDGNTITATATTSSTAVTIDPTTGAVHIPNELSEDSSTLTVVGLNNNVEVADTENVIDPSEGATVVSTGIAQTGTSGKATYTLLTATDKDATGSTTADEPIIKVADSAGRSDGSVTVTPGADNVQVVTTFIDEDGNWHEVTAVYDKDSATWSATENVASDDGTVISTGVAVSTGTATDDNYVIDPTTGTLTIGADKVEDLSPVTATGTDADENYAVAEDYARADDATPNTTNAPTVVENEDNQGSVIVTPDKTVDDQIYVVIKYTSEDTTDTDGSTVSGEEHALIAVKDSDGNWSLHAYSSVPTTDSTGEATLTNDSFIVDTAQIAGEAGTDIATIDPTTGAVTFSRDALKDGTYVTAIGVDSNSNAAQSTLIAPNDPTVDVKAPIVNYNNGDVFITPIDDATTVTVTFTPKGSSSTVTVTATLTDGEWAISGDANGATIDSISGEITLDGIVADNTDVSAYSNKTVDGTVATSETATTHVPADTVADQPQITTEDADSLVTITPGQDNVKMTITYADSTLVVSKGSDGTWSITSGSLSDSSRKSVFSNNTEDADLDSATGVVKLPVFPVDDTGAGTITVVGTDDATTPNESTNSKTVDYNDSTTTSVTAPTLVAQSDGGFNGRVGDDNWLATLTFYHKDSTQMGYTLVRVLLTKSEDGEWSIEGVYNFNRQTQVIASNVNTTTDDTLTFTASSTTGDTAWKTEGAYSTSKNSSGVTSLTGLTVNADGSFTMSGSYVYKMSTGTSPVWAKGMDIYGNSSSLTSVTAKTASSENTADAASVVANEGGSVTVTPQGNDTKVVVSYVNESGKTVIVTLEKNSSDEWEISGSAPKGLTVDSTTGELTIPSENVKDESTVTATAYTAGNNSGYSTLVTSSSAVSLKDAGVNIAELLAQEDFANIKDDIMVWNRGFKKHTDGMDDFIDAVETLADGNYTEEDSTITINAATTTNEDTAFYTPYSMGTMKYMARGNFMKEMTVNFGDGNDVFIAGRNIGNDDGNDPALRTHLNMGEGDNVVMGGVSTANGEWDLYWSKEKGFTYVKKGLTPDGDYGWTKIQTNLENLADSWIGGVVRNAEITAGDGDDTVVFGGVTTSMDKNYAMTKSRIDLGDGDNTLIISPEGMNHNTIANIHHGGMTESTVVMGSGSDKIEVALIDNSQIYTDAGDDVIQTARIWGSNSLIETGAGADKVYIGGTMAGQDVKIGGEFSAGQVNLGDGDDHIEYYGRVMYGSIDGGDGDDLLVLGARTDTMSGRVAQADTANVKNVEVIELLGANTINVQVQQLTNTIKIHKADGYVETIDGAVNPSKVDLGGTNDFGSATQSLVDYGGDWTKSSTQQTENGHTYDVYTHSQTSYEVWIESSNHIIVI